MNTAGLTKNQIAIKAENMGCMISSLTNAFANGIKVEIILDITEEKIANEPDSFEKRMLVQGEDYAVIIYKNGFRRYINISANSDWCIITEIADCIMRHM